ncbi:MAG: hypothetical protein ABJZ55_02700 [Fuerstiella sp.]
MAIPRMEWCRAALTALITITISLSLTTSSSVMAQPPTRIGDNSTNFNDFNQLLQNGSRSNLQHRQNSGVSGTSVDLSQVDTRVLSNLMRETVSESEKLYRSLERDYQRNPEVRSLLRELVTQRARAARLTSDMQAGASLERLLPDMQKLDSDWHYLSNQMSQTRQLSRTTVDSQERISRLQRQLEKLFEMEPQLDRRALLVELSSLDSAMRNLVQELETDFSSGVDFSSLIIDARKLDRQAYRVQELVLDQQQYHEVVAGYNRFSQMWTALRPQMQLVQNRYIDRTIRDIMMLDDRLHDLLWIEQQTSREDLKQIAGSLMRDVDEFYARLNLKLMLNFKDVNSILEEADNFYGTVKNFNDSANANASSQQLLRDYQVVEEYGNKFVRAFTPLKSRTGQVVLREIEDGIVGLRNELNLSGTVSTIDTRRLIPIAATLETLADELSLDVGQWLNRERPSYASKVMDNMQRFVQRSSRLHSQMQYRPTSQELQREMSDLVQEWRNVYEDLGKCRTEHRSRLIRLSSEISEAIFELRTPLQL